MVVTWLLHNICERSLLSDSPSTQNRHPQSLSTLPSWGSVSHQTWQCLFHRAAWPESPRLQSVSVYFAKIIDTHGWPWQMVSGDLDWSCHDCIAITYHLIISSVVIVEFWKMLRLRPDWEGFLFILHLRPSSRREWWETKEKQFVVVNYVMKLRTSELTSNWISKFSCFLWQ